MWQWCIQPFIESAEMQRALLGIVCLALGAAPLGVLLQLRRMSLMGDAMSHAVLPGVALGYLVAGQNPWIMGAGGLAAGLLMALGVGVASRRVAVKEDAHLAAFYLTSLALGVVIVTQHGTSDELLHMLFGSVLEVDAPLLTLLCGVAIITLAVLAVARRPLLLQAVDPLFLQARGGWQTGWHVLFLMLVVLNLVAGFQALGTLMGVGLMMLPAIVARMWARSMRGLLLLTWLLALACGYGGLLLAYHAQWPSGPAIILLCASLYAVSLLTGGRSGLFGRWLR